MPSDDPFGQEEEEEQRSGSTLARVFALLRSSVVGVAGNLRTHIRDLVESPDGISRNLKFIIGGTLGISFLLVIALLLFYRPSAGQNSAETARKSADLAGSVATAGAALQPGQSAAGSPGGTILSWISTPIGPEQYLVERERGFGTGIQWRLSRQPRDSWSTESIRRFWIDPTKLVVEHLSKRNEKLVDSLLSSAP